MTLVGLLAWVLIGAPPARASLSKDLLGFPTDEVQMNAVCQALLARGGGADGDYAVATFREMRVRQLGRSDIEPSVHETFRVHSGSDPRDLNKLAEHLLGVERWVRGGHGAIYGFVLTGPDQILTHERRLVELRESLVHELRDSDLCRGVTRLSINSMFSYLFVQGVQNGPAALLALVPIFLIVNPYLANRTLFIKDFAGRKFGQARARMFAAPESADWDFSSRTYRVFSDVNKALDTLSLNEVASAMSHQNWWRLSPPFAPIEALQIFLKKGRKAALDFDARSRNAYVIVDTLSRFDPASGEPQVIRAVRTTSIRPRRIFAPVRESRGHGIAGSLPAAR